MSVRKGDFRCPKCGNDVINNYDWWEKKGDKWILHQVVNMMVRIGFTGILIVMLLIIAKWPKNVGNNMEDQLQMIGMNHLKINGLAIIVRKQEIHFWNFLIRKKNNDYLVNLRE